MAAIKCIKCGANIPNNAAFCPACGAPKAEAQQMSQPVQSQPMQYKSMNKTVSPLEGIFNMFFSKTAIIIGIVLGILFAWIGVIIMIFASGSTDVGLLLSSMGFAAIGLFILCGGIWNRKINAYARLAMVLIGGYLLANGVSALSLLSRYWIG